MKLSISNIAWDKEKDKEVYGLMRKYGFDGLEIAPTRIFPEKPYDNLEKAEKWHKKLFEEYGFFVSSMQSIWFGRQEKIFGSEEERSILFDYTKKSIDFASAIKCHNLVFGCPGNRKFYDGADLNVAVSFFHDLGEYALSKGTVIGMEANPAIYNTNYINETAAAIELIGKAGSGGFRLNLDAGTMLCNQENISILEGRTSLISHVHISEPGLKAVCERKLHKELAVLLKAEEYDGFVSIEMEKQDDLYVVEKTMAYVKEIFG